MKHIVSILAQCTTYMRHNRRSIAIVTIGVATLLIATDIKIEQKIPTITQNIISWIGIMIIFTLCFVRTPKACNEPTTAPTEPPSVPVDIPVEHIDSNNLFNIPEINTGNTNYATEPPPEPPPTSWIAFPSGIARADKALYADIFSFATSAPKTRNQLMLKINAWGRHPYIIRHWDSERVCIELPGAGSHYTLRIPVEGYFKIDPAQTSETL